MAQVQWPEGALEAFLRMQYDAQSKHYFENYPGARFLVVEADGLPAGRFYYQDTPDVVRVLDIVLLPGARGRGVGTNLLRSLMDCKRVVLHVEKNNRALSLYLRLGFRTVEDKGVYWMLEWHPIS